MNIRIPPGVAFETGIPGVSIDTREPEKPTPPPPAPLVKRCANGCGQRISQNRLLCHACLLQIAAEAAKKEPHGQTDSSNT